MRSRADHVVPVKVYEVGFKKKTFFVVFFPLALIAEATVT